MEEINIKNPRKGTSRLELKTPQTLVYCRISEAETNLKTSDFQQEKLLLCLFNVAVYPIFRQQTKDCVDQNSNKIQTNYELCRKCRT